LFAELMAQFARTGRIEYRHAPAVLMMAFVSLVSGGALGPEAPLMDATGGIGTWLADRFKAGAQGARAMAFAGLSGMLGAFFSSPWSAPILVLEASQGATTILVLIPGIVGASSAIAAFMLLGGAFFEPLYVFPIVYEQVRFLDLAYALPLGLVGGAAGLLYMGIYRALRRTVMAPLAGRPVLRGLLGGLGLGIIGAALPLTLFSGEHQLQEIIDHGAEIGVVTLLAIAIAKMFLTNLALTTGWKGGYIFPIVFAGGALGMAVHLLLPFIPQSVAMTAVMAGITASTLRSPIFVALFLAALTQRELAPVMAIAVVVSFLLTMNASMLPAQAPSGRPANGPSD
jgi:H+/Cl- antiporter ClcA